MNIKVEKWIFDEDVESYHILDIEKCCDELIENEDYITICCDDGYSVKIMSSYDAYDGWDDCRDIITNYKAINYCPFCGEKINIEIVNTIDKTAEYEKLINKRDSLNIQRRKTDSKKEERELSEEIEILDKQIKMFYKSDCFKDYLRKRNKNYLKL